MITENQRVSFCKEIKVDDSVSCRFDGIELVLDSIVRSYGYYVLVQIQFSLVDDGPV